MVDAGFSATDLKTAGYNLADLKAGFNLADATDAGFSATDLKAAGFSLAVLKAASSSNAIRKTRALARQI